MRFPLILLLIFSSGHVHASSDDDLARTFYPPALSAWVQDHPGVAERQEWATAAADLDHIGTANYLVIAYSNGHIGRLQVIKKTPAGPVLVGDPSTPALYDDDPGVSLVDVNHDGKPEIVASYHTGNHGERLMWIFAWDGSNVRPLNPPDPDDPAKVIAFRASDFVDLNGDGTLAVVEPSDTYGVKERFATPEGSHDVVPDTSCNVYTLINGTFANSPRTVTYYEYFTRSKGAPKPVVERFISRQGNYILRIANGSGGKDLVDSAEVKLNGVVVLSADAFNNHKRVITVPVTLQQQNTISVELRSAPGSQLRLLIEPSS